MLQEIAELGFERVELGHGTRMSLLPGILKALAENMVRVGSVHNFCPLPLGVNYAAPNVFQPSSPDKRELEQWRRHTIKTLDFAYSVGADRMVAHMGSIFFFFLTRPDRRFKNARQQREADALAEDKAYARRREKLLKKLRKQVPKHRDRIRQCLESVAEACQQKEFFIGAENREGLLELPLEENFADFFEQHKDLPCVRGWHDTGHAKLKEQMGFMEHEKLIQSYADKIIGWHLHDVTPEGKDHVEIGTGTVDWPMIKQYIKPKEHAIVLELSPSLSRNAVLRSKAYVEKLLR